ncbi:ion transport peptide isoform X2 [Lycorma delicatula]
MLLWSRILASLMVASTLSTCLLASPTMREPRQTMDGDVDANGVSHSITKRSFFDLKCKGVYDRSIFARLDRICEDCYNLFREHSLHSLCRKDCFTSDYFKGCIDVLLLQDELQDIQSWIKTIHGADPNV